MILNRRLQQTNLAYYSGLLPAALATIAMSATTVSAGNLLTGWDALPRLIACTSIGATAYGAWLMGFHREWFMGCVHLLAGRRAQLA